MAALKNLNRENVLDKKELRHDFKITVCRLEQRKMQLDKYLETKSLVTSEPNALLKKTKGGERSTRLFACTKYKSRDLITLR